MREPDRELGKGKKSTSAAVAPGQTLVTHSRVSLVFAQFVHHQTHLLKVKGQLYFLETYSVTDGLWRAERVHVIGKINRRRARKSSRCKWIKLVRYDGN